MKISIVTTVRNKADTLGAAMKSVVSQRLNGFELEYIVIDGASTDGTAEIIKNEESRMKNREMHGFSFKWISEPDCGMYDGINKGIRMATGDVVGILNADDVLSDDRVIERVAEVFGNVSGERLTVNRKSGDDRHQLTAHGLRITSVPDALYGDIRFVADRRGIGLDELRAEPTLRHYSARHWRPWMLQWGFMPPHPSVYIRRECFERLGDYALDYKIAADYALLIRFLRKARLSSRYVPMCFVDMRVGGMSTKNWKSNLLLNREIVRGNREAGYFCCLPMLLPKYAFKVFEFVLPRLRNVFSRKDAKAQRCGERH